MQVSCEVYWLMAVVDGDGADVLRQPSSRHKLFSRRNKFIVIFYVTLNTETFWYESASNVKSK